MKEKREDRGNTTAEAGVVSLSQFNLNMQVKTYKGRDINARKVGAERSDLNILYHDDNIKTKL